MERWLAEHAICKHCGMPNIIWQSWRNLFRCGWCRFDYLPEQVEKLERLPETEVRKIVYKRKLIILGASHE